MAPTTEQREIIVATLEEQAVCRLPKWYRFMARAISFRFE